MVSRCKSIRELVPQVAVFTRGGDTGKPGIVGDTDRLGVFPVCQEVADGVLLASKLALGVPVQN